MRTQREPPIPPRRLHLHSQAATNRDDWEDLRSRSGSTCQLCTTGVPYGSSEGHLLRQASKAGVSAVPQIDVSSRSPSPAGSAAAPAAPVVHGSEVLTKSMILRGEGWTVEDSERQRI